MHRLSMLCRLWWVPALAVLAFALPGSQSCPPRRLVVVPVKVGPADETKMPATPEQSLVNLKDKNLSFDFDIGPPPRNVLWQAKLGKVSYAGPVVAGGKVFVGTNNENPRDQALKGDAGVIMCFEAKTGK